MKSYKNSVKTILRTSKLITLTLLGAIQSANLPSAEASPVSSRTPVSAQAGSGGRIAFSSTRAGYSDIYIMNADGSHQTRVAYTAGMAAGSIEPSISPDGNKIVFTMLGLVQNRSEICSINSDGTGLTRLTDNVAQEWTPSWSPDGTKIAFISNRDGDFELFVMNADGSNQKQLSHNTYDDFGPATWSPDGNKIAYISNRSGIEELFSVYVINADGTNEHRLFPNYTESQEFPAWSPDGKKMAFRDPRFSIYAINIDGSDVKKLTVSAGAESWPSWSPDSTQIGFSKATAGEVGDSDYLFYKVNPDGTNLIQVTTAGSNVWNPSWGRGTVKPTSDVPVAYDRYRDLYEDQPTSFTLSGYDPYGKPLTYSLLSKPVFGKLSGTAPNLTYTPNLDYNGYDAFLFKVNNGSKDSLTARVDLYVRYVDDPPTISAISDQVIDADNKTNVIPFTIGNDTPTDWLPIDFSKHIITASSDNPTLFSQKGIILGGTQTNRTIQLTPASKQKGTANITVRVEEPSKLFSTTTFKVTVKGANNDLPTISAVPDQTIDEDSSYTSLNFVVGDKETAVNGLNVTATSSNQDIFNTNSIVLSGQSAQRSITLLPRPNVNGVSTITLKVKDGAGDVAQTSFTINVNAVNDAPTISAIENKSINEDSNSLAINFTVQDSDTPVGSLIVTATSSNQSLFDPNSLVLGGSGAQRILTVKPLPNANGTATITLKVNDGVGGLAEKSFTITVRPVNDAPVAQPLILTGIANQSLPVNLSATDIDSSNLTYEIVSAPVSGILSGFAPKLTFVPTVGGTVTFSYRASDPQGATSEVTTVTIINSVPQGLKVSGRLLNYKPNANYNGAVSSPVNNLRVRLEQKGKNVYEVPVDNSGLYTFYGVTGGEYVARIYSLDGKTMSFDPLYQAAKVKSADVILKDFALYSVYGQVTATIVSGKTKTVVPVAGATINVSMPVSGSTPITAALTTDAQGLYSLSGFPKGKVTLLVSNAGVTFASKGKYTVSLPASASPNKPNARYDIKGTAASNPNSSPKASIQKS